MSVAIYYYGFPSVMVYLLLICRVFRFIAPTRHSKRFVGHFYSVWNCGQIWWNDGRPSSMIGKLQSLIYLVLVNCKAIVINRTVPPMGFQFLGDRPEQFRTDES